MKLALTGGIGCGKSTVVRAFASAGWDTMETDVVVRDLLTSCDSVKAELRAWWGGAIFHDDGSVDRRKVAELVFADETELKRLELLLHPMVRAIWMGKLDSIGNGRCLIEIPLLFEKRLENAFDFSVSIISSPHVVTERMVQRGFTESEVERRRTLQMPIYEKLRMSDFVLSNDGTLDFLHLQIAHLIAQITPEQTTNF